MPREDLSRSGRSRIEPGGPVKTGTGLRPERIAPLDGIRGLAILAVVLMHYDAFLDRHVFFQHILTSIFDYGWAGVDLFFVLSGFLITRILLATREASNYFRAFYARRVLRIFPLYYASLLLLFGVLIPKMSTEPSPTAPEIFRYFLYLQNWFMPLQWSGQYWSLAVEEQFYLMWPLVVYNFERKRLLHIAIGGSILSLLLRSALVIAGANPVLILTNVFTRLDALLMGSACACLMQQNGFEDRLRRPARWFWCAPLASFPALRLAAGSFHNTAPVILSVGYTIVGVSCAGVLLTAVLTAGSRSLLQRFLTHPAMRMLGKYSYAAYIWHVLVRVTVLYLEQTWLRVSTPWFVNIPLMFAITIGVSMLSHAAIERPFLSLKRYFEPAIRTAAARAS
ncbi:MAG TPA: acyltransferase [Bryobacteraceae bacterium]|nr:acyltransferase [Bryobacteraceae bacterium]